MTVERTGGRGAEVSDLDRMFAMQRMDYKGYTADIDYSEEDGCSVGHLVGIRDIVGFDGESMTAIARRFHEAVDGYLAAREKLGQVPNPPCSGQVR